MSRIFTDPADAAAALADGGVLLLNTDTLPGFHCRADHPGAVARLAAIKGRPDGKPLLVLAGSADQAAGLLLPLTAHQADVCARCWPGPFSLILPAAASVDPTVTGGGATVAVRVPRPAGLRSLILAAGGPLVSTSVNLAGEPPETDLEAAAQRFSDRVDGVWNDGRTAPAGGPSALVDVTVRPPALLRSGPEEMPPFR